MTLPKYREKYNIKTKFRLLDSAYGKYGSITSFEFEEGVRSTSTMSEEDILFFRPVHWLIQFLWNYRAYYPLLKYLFSRGINPYDFITSLLENTTKAPGAVQQIISDFHNEARNEWFDTPESLRTYYIDHFDILQSGEVGKMNSKYTWRVIIECKHDFNEYVRQIAVGFVPDSEDIINELIRYSSTRLIDFTSDLNSSKVNNIMFAWDIFTWEMQGYTGDIVKKPIECTFSLAEEKKNSLIVLLDQYKHENINVTLRKMSEHIKFDDLYYDIECVPY
jgi:hypothetical protein